MTLLWCRSSVSFAVNQIEAANFPPIWFWNTWLNFQVKTNTDAHGAAPGFQLHLEVCEHNVIITCHLLHQGRVLWLPCWCWIWSLIEPGLQWWYFLLLVSFVATSTLNWYENRTALYMRALGIETEVTVGFHLMGNRFQINLIPKNIMKNNHICRQNYPTLCWLTLTLYHQAHCGTRRPVINNVHLEHKLFYL